MTARRLDFDAIDEAGWTQVRDGAHGFDLPLYYISVAEQRWELRAAGLELVEILGPSGERVDPNVLDGVPHLHDLCQPAPRRDPNRPRSLGRSQDSLPGLLEVISDLGLSAGDSPLALLGRGHLTHKRSLLVGGQPPPSWDLLAELLEASLAVITTWAPHGVHASDANRIERPASVAGFAQVVRLKTLVRNPAHLSRAACGALIGRVTGQVGSLPEGWMPK